MIQRDIWGGEPLFHACAHPIRWQILGLLEAGAMHVYELNDEMEVPRSTLSRELAHLRRLRLIHSVSNQQWRRYSLNPKFAPVLESLRAAEEAFRKI